MKITASQLTEVLRHRPITWGQEDTKEMLSLIGLSIKEYRSDTTIRTYRSFEVHNRRLYLFRVMVDESRCADFNNEYVDFGDGCHGVSFGGTDTVKELMRLIINMAARLDRNYNGEISFNADESEYTEQEFQELVQVLNDELFANAE